MIPRKFHVYTVDLNPRFGTEPGKIRPVVVVQTNLLNEDCLDQVEYMGNMLRLEELVQRIKHYIDLRDRGMIPGPSGEKQPLRIEASRMLQEILVNGVSTRGEVIQASGLKERTGRNLLGMLLKEGLLVSDSPKGEVKLGFPIHAAGWYFPELYPTI